MVAQRVVRTRFDVRGIIQGVGFRPYVHALARELSLSGSVGNDDAGVRIEVQGAPDAVAAFAELLERRAPPLARIQSVDTVELPTTDHKGFVILQSDPGGRAEALVAPDVATCTECLAEVADPEDRRFGYAFTNCTNCGPRYSVITDIPYDRPNTTMAGFELCQQCRREYLDPEDRRFHAQPVCCPQCGPRLSDTIAGTAAALGRGEIVAIKGLGGYHLAVRADDAAAVRRLRARKHRADKPFALMVADVVAAEALCRTSTAEAELLSSIERPIVLLERRGDASVAKEVAPHTHELGVMLPYTPLHHMLLRELGAALVCTSANVSDEPIAYRDHDAAYRLAGIADSFLTHDRPIHIRVEDSVARVVRGAPYLIRRSRGYAPAPVQVRWPAPRPILACGAELKNTIAYARGHDVFLSHHIGDLTTAEAHGAFLEAVEHLGRLFCIEPEVVAVDLHPQYLSSGYGSERAGVDLVGVQHHHAHVAACIADAAHEGAVIGVAFDGLGYGDDGTLWGGEFLLADLAGYTRAGWFSPVPMPGGDAATREPWRMAAAYLDAAGLADVAHTGVAARNPTWTQVLQMGRTGLNSPMTSSVGRLFDAVAALLDVRDRAHYEGQAAIELEQLVDPSERSAHLAQVCHRGGGYVVHGADLVAAAVEDLSRGIGREQIAMRFHRGLAAAVVDVCERIRADKGVSVVALSGGVFLNTVLLGLAIDGLEAVDFTVLRHRRVPCNDGGISFGQAVVAAARDREAARPG